MVDKAPQDRALCLSEKYVYFLLIVAAIEFNIRSFTVLWMDVGVASRRISTHKVSRTT
jgi:hypothetical protein